MAEARLYRRLSVSTTTRGLAGHHQQDQQKQQHTRDYFTFHIFYTIK